MGGPTEQLTNAVGRNRGAEKNNQQAELIRKNAPGAEPHARETGLASGHGARKSDDGNQRRKRDAMTL